MSLMETNQLLAESQHLILKGCLAGDRASQAKLYNMYARKMMGVCMWYAKNKEEAEEILQDGFMRVFTYLHKFRSEGSFEGWIRKTMVSAALSKYRSKSSHLRPVVEFNTDFHDVHEDAAFVSQYDERELVKLIQTLSPVYRLVFNLYVFEGLKHREIAAALNISENTSKSNLADARKILQTALMIKKKIEII
ncbi:MAG TPA: sigma-70 family RNA polymerase sigma factor [Chitinophagaceae bacterium]|nr:sigma-70 family RNA polymerase sigma factor [Chitinophagaceae bacterium]